MLTVSTYVASTSAISIELLDHRRSHVTPPRDVFKDLDPCDLHARNPRVQAGEVDSKMIPDGLFVLGSWHFDELFASM